MGQSNSQQDEYQSLSLEHKHSQVVHEATMHQHSQLPAVLQSAAAEPVQTSCPCRAPPMEKEDTISVQIGDFTKASEATASAAMAAGEARQQLSDMSSFLEERRMASENQRVAASHARAQSMRSQALAETKGTHHRQGKSSVTVSLRLSDKDQQPDFMEMPCTPRCAQLRKESPWELLKLSHIDPRGIEQKPLWTGRKFDQVKFTM